MICEREEPTRTIGDVEYEIKSVDRVLKLVRADREADSTLEGKLAIIKHERYIEALRAKLRREMFAMIDADERAGGKP